MDVSRSSRALRRAVKAGRVLLVKLLLRTVANVNERDWLRQTALHLACESRHKNMQRVMDVLLRSGAEVNAQDFWGTTPLHKACRNTDLTAVLTLLRNGANIGLVDNEGKTPLHIATGKCLKTSMISIVRALLADYRAVDTEETSPRDLDNHNEVGEALNVVSVMDRNGNTALHFASENNEREVVRLLLSMGAQVGVKNKIGKTVLHYAGQNCASDIIDILVDNGEDVNSKDNGGNTPLHLACSSMLFYEPTGSTVEAIEKLLNAGAKVYEKNLRSKTPHEELNLHQHLLKGSFEDMFKIETSFIKHVVLLKATQMHPRIDLECKLGIDFYNKVRNQCCLEVEYMKSTKIVKDVSLYELLSHPNHPHRLSHDDLLRVNEFLCSPDLLEDFPLYGLTLRTAFQREARAVFVLD